MADNTRDAEARAAAEKKVNQTLSQRKTILRDELLAIEDTLGVYQSIEQQINIQTDLMQKEAELAQVLKQDAVEQLASERQKGVIHQGRVNDLLKEVKIQEDIIQRVNEQNAALNNVTTQTDNLIGSLTGIGDQWKNTIVGSIVDAADKSENLVSVTSRIAESLKRNITFSNVFGSTMLKIQEATLAVVLAQDEATSAFAKGTGTGTKYFSMITDISEQNRVFGISAEDSAAAVGVLYKDLNRFSELSPQAAKEMAGLVAKLDAVGISSETSAANIDIAMNALGMNSKAAQNLQLDLVATADALALPPQTVAEGFARAAPQLAAHGKSMVGVFKDLARQSKETGLEIETLLGYASQFNTFEGAAQQTADLNHLLGGAYLNSLELLNATEAERIEIIQQSIKASGKSFDQMDVHTKRAFAHQMGLQSVAEASKLLTPLTLEQVKANKKAADIEAELAEKAKAMQPIWKAAQSAISSLAISMLPFLNYLKDGIVWILELNDKTREWFGGTMSLLPALAILGTTVLGIVKVMKMGAALKALWISLTAASTAATVSKTVADELSTGALLKQSIAQKTANSKSVGGAKAMMGYAAAVALAGVGIAAAALGMAQFVKAFNGMPPESIYAVATAIGVFMVGMIGLSVAMGVIAAASGAAAVPLLAVGAAVALVGVGVGLAAAGMSLLADSLVLGLTAVGANIGGFLAFVGGLSILSMLGPALGVTLLALTPTSWVMASIAESIGEMVANINELNLTKILELNKLLGVKVAPESVEFAASGIAASVSAGGVSRSQASAPAPVQPSKNAGSAQVKPINITLKIDDREIAKIAWKEIRKELEQVGGKGLIPA